MHDLLAGHGYPALFTVSFLASTLLPIGSEWLVVAMVAEKFSPLLVVAVSTCGNVLGASTTYALARWGGKRLAGRLFRFSPEEEARAGAAFTRFGSWSLLLSWLPVVGDGLCLVAGFLRTPLPLFFLLVSLGKAARYCVVAWLTLRLG